MVFIGLGFIGTGSDPTRFLNPNPTDKSSKKNGQKQTELVKISIKMSKICPKISKIRPKMFKSAQKCLKSVKKC